MTEVLGRLFDTADFSPRWNCGAWTPALGWTHVLSDIGIWAAYLAIPLVLWYCVARRRDVPFRGVVALFGAFILACGTTHFMEAALFWWPAYRLAGLLKVAALLVSWTAVVALYRTAPRLLALRSPEAMECEVAERTAELARANAALRASEARFRQLADAMPPIVWITDPDGETRYLNRRWAEYTGLTAANPDDIRRVVHPDDLPGMYAVWDAATRTGGSYQFEFRLRPAAGGDYRWFLARSVRATGDDGAPAGWYGTSTDVDDLKRAEAEIDRRRAELQLVLDAVPALIFYKDRDHKLVRVNQELARLFGRPKAEIEGRTDADLGSPHAARYSRDDDAVMATGEPVRGVVEPLDTPGGTRWLETTKLPLRDDAGQVAGVIGFAVDVTDRRTAEEALRASETRVKAVLDTVVDGIITIDDRGTVESANPAAERLFGYPAADLLGRNVSLLMPDPHRAAHDRYLAAYRANDVPRVIGTGREVHGRRKDGAEFPLELSIGEARLAGGRRVFTGVLRDITDRKRAEEALRAGEARFRQLADAMPQVVWTAGPDGHLDYYNQKWYELTAAAGGKPGPRGWLPVLHPDDRRPCVARWSESVRTGEPYQIEYRFRFPATGEYRWHLGRALPVKDAAGRVVRWYGTSTDIHDQKVAEEQVRRLNADLERRVAERTAALEAQAAELRESERRFRAVFDQTLQFIGLMSPDGTLLEGNRSALAAAGVTPDQVFGRPFWDTPWWTHDPALQARVRDAVRRAAAGETVRFEASHPRPDGDLVWVDFSLKPFYDEAGRVVLLIPEGRDMTSRKRAEEALRESEERFRSAFEDAPIGMALVAPTGRFLRVNRALCELVGYAGDELLATHFQTITHPDDLEADLVLVLRVLAGGLATFQMEKRYFHKQGHVVHVLLSVSLVRDGAGEPMYFVSQVLDITGRKQAEDQLRASLREKEVLLREIHHRVKNNLQIVSTLLDLQADHTADPAALTMFQESRGRVRSMALIHERLYRSGDLARVDFTAYARQLADDLFRSYKVGEDQVRLVVDVAVPPFPLDVAIPCGLLINELISNCLKHAFRGRAQGTVEVSLARDGGANVLVVADDGVGFPPDLDFRRTASFGLQLVNTLVEQLAGGVELAGGRGTRVVIRFPAKG